jgi:hypothetical protein
MNYTIIEKLDKQWVETHIVNVIELKDKRKFVLSTNNDEGWSPEYRNKVCLTLTDTGNELILEKDIKIVNYSAATDIINLLEVAINHNAVKYQKKIVSNEI